MNRLMAAALAVCAAGCSSSSGGSSAPTDGGGGDGAVSNVFTCGKGSLSGTARATDPNGLGPVAGATVSAPGCTTAVTDGRGYVTVNTDPGLLIKLDVSASGYMNEHAEFYVPSGAPAGFNLTGWAYATTTKTTVFKGWTDSDGYVGALVTAMGDGGACASPAGITLSVKSHPELKAVYLKDPMTPDTTLAATVSVAGNVGGAVFGPVPPGTYEIDGAKTGCTIGPLAASQWHFDTTFDVKAGALSFQLLQSQ